MKKSSQWIGSFCLLYLVSCGVGIDKSKIASVDFPHFEPRVIFDTDDRLPLTDRFLLDTIGKFRGPYGINCTGFISNSNELTVAGHCYNGINDIDLFSFTTGSGRKIAIKSLIDFASSADVAVFEIETQKTYLETTDLKEGSVEVIGFDIDTNKIVRSTCKPEPFDEKQGVILHKCDTVGGQSGSPIIQNGKAVGIHIGSLKEPFSNIGISLANIKNVDIASLGVIIPETKVKLCEGVYKDVAMWSAGYCGASFATALGSCAIAIGSGGTELISDSVCALALLNVKIACGLGTVAATGYIYKCLFE